MAKRISLILMGPPAVCECGPSGAVLARPHECPKMARSRPDILRDTETTDMISVMEKSNGKHSQVSTLPALVEDPVRRVYKKLLAVTFIPTCSLYILLDLIFQVRSEVSGVHLQSYLLCSNIDTVHSHLQLSHLLPPGRGGVQTRGEPWHQSLHPADHQPSELPLLGVRGKVRRSFDSLAPACVLRYKARLSSLDYKVLGNSLFKSRKYKEAIIKYELALKWRWR